MGLMWSADDLQRRRNVAQLLFGQPGREMLPDAS